MMAKRILFWFLVVLFVSSIGWWVFYFPYSAEKLYRAIPQNATFISEHGRLAERWKTIAGNPLTLSLLATVGFQYEDTAKTVADPDVRAMVEKLAGKNVVIAYVPSLRGSGRPAWVLSSWVGGNGQVFRWSTAGIMAGINLKEVRLNTGRSIWTLVEKENPSDPDVSIAIVEGVLLMCLSSDPTDVKCLVDRIEYGAPLQPDLQDRFIAGRNGGDEQVMDRGWIRWKEPKGDDYLVRRLKYVLTAHDARHSEGWVSGDADLLLPSPKGGQSVTNVTEKGAGFSLKDSTGIENLKDVPGVSPDAFLVAPFALFEPLLMDKESPRGVRIVTRALKSQADTNTAFFLSMFGGERSGRILGLKVPTFLVGVHVADEGRSMGKVSETVDILNASYKLSVIPRREDVAGRAVIVVESTRQQGVFDSIAPTDKPAVTCKGRWLTISSSFETLTNVVCRQAQDESANGQWARGIRSVKDCAGYMWVDFERSSEAIKHAIAAYSLVLMAQNSGESSETRKQLAVLDTWVRGLKPVKTAEFKLTFSGDQFRVGFSLGPAGPSLP